MPKQKNQHYVPRCLLKNFTDKNGKFFIFRLLQNKILDIKIPYYDQCKTEYFYGSDGIIENKLKKFEDRVSNVFNKIISNTALNTYEELCLKQFVLLQYFRTEHMVDKRLYLMLESLNKILPTVLIQKGVKFSKEEIDSYIRTYIGKLSRSDTVQDSVHLALESINHLDDLALEIIHTKNKRSYCDGRSI